MNPETAEQAKAWNSALDMGYIRQVEISGRIEWALFNGEGDVVHHSDNRSAPFFFAAEHEVIIQMLN